MEVIEAELETIRHPPPYPAERMIFADDEMAAGLQDARGFSVVAPQVGHPYRDMAAGIDDIVGGIADT